MTYSYEIYEIADGHYGYRISRNDGTLTRVMIEQTVAPELGGAQTMTAAQADAVAQIIMADITARAAQDAQRLAAITAAMQ